MLHTKPLYPIMVIAAALLAGCITNSPIRKEVLADPSTTPEVRAAVEKRQIRVGMTQKEVIASWGSPCNTCYGTRSATWGDTWEYNLFGNSRHGIGGGTYLFFDRAGRLKNWSTR